MDQALSEEGRGAFAYLDIETNFDKVITVIGVFRPGPGTRQWVAPGLSTEELREFLGGIDALFTYNGGRFDLPIIQEQMGLDLKREFNHRDLMYDCWSRSLFGGLKKVEKTLGIHRDTEGIDGLAAVRLWEEYRKGNSQSLDTLLHYNREDVENLEILAAKLGLFTLENVSPGTTVLGAKA